MVKGYSALFTGIYNSSALPEFSVGECWDGTATIKNWDTGVEMTYNLEKRCWETTTTLGEGVIKFKGNGTWDNQDGNWGGTLDNIINGSNDNIPIRVTGKVHIEFYPKCDTKSYATITPAE